MLTCSRKSARAREGRGGVMMALAARARRWCATAPRFNNCVEGARVNLLAHVRRARGAAV